MDIDDLMVETKQKWKELYNYRRQLERHLESLNFSVENAPTVEVMNDYINQISDLIPYLEDAVEAEQEQAEIFNEYASFRALEASNRINERLDEQIAAEALIDLSKYRR